MPAGLRLVRARDEEIHLRRFAAESLEADAGLRGEEIRQEADLGADAGPQAGRPGGEPERAFQGMSLERIVIVRYHVSPQRSRGRLPDRKRGLDRASGAQIGFINERLRDFFDET